ncbi:hypothetical protein KQI42_09885 [Tissierella sp. MSJ-40]|uniref:Uncharacterized protein n=1 Tax=Tissierella simiarum TaxID=2841534 RepID=A0ABS6E5W0_9FIRM|nr:hypothetical protein [Tissierella simiarum]MBU5438320.1 hypothetical protein [Tissierella simiarum]
MLVNNSILKEKKVDTEELAKALCNLSNEEKMKIYYMIKGIELISESRKEVMAAGA